MSLHKHHEEIIKGVSEQFKEILDSSAQAIYIYLDDSHKLCNKRFAQLLGFKSEREWAKVDESFLSAFVDGKSQNKLVDAYRKAIEKCVGSSIAVTWKAKSGKKVNTKVILVPVAYQGHLLALHFISK